MKDKQDRPRLREKILNIINNVLCIGGEGRYIENRAIATDQILAIIPDIEEAKKQERERITQELTELFVGNKDGLEGLIPIIPKYIQALKEEK